MELQEKLSILADSAKYDVSCASSGSSRENGGGLGAAHASGICHSWSSDGRCISLLKILLTNHCILDCAYCVNRRSNAIPRAAFTPREVAELTIGFYRRNYIEGLFLSSGIMRSPDFTMEKMLETLRLLREEWQFSGYIHCKLIPGCDSEYVLEASRLADRVSANIELPNATLLQQLAPEKNRDSLFLPLKIARKDLQLREEKKTGKNHFAGMSTQLIVGAGGESDQEILRLSEAFYQKGWMKRVYYSAYLPVGDQKRIPIITPPPLLREHRLYQADWLLRFYGFGVRELLDEGDDLSLDFDPKMAWALRHLHLFPVELNRVDYEILIRIPGIGIRSARKIIQARRQKRLNGENLKSMKIPLKRARYFLMADNCYLGGKHLSMNHVQTLLLSQKEKSGYQPSLFDPSLPSLECLTKSVTGEL